MFNFKKQVRKVINFIGYEIIRLPNLKIKGYERILPIANYAPWQHDHTFLKIFDTIRTHTLVDKYRCFELWHLVSQSLKLNGALIEVGVWRGGTAALICKVVELSGQYRPIYLADTFEGVVKSSDKDTYYIDGYHSDTSIDIVSKLLRDEMGLNNYKLLEGIFPEETSHLVDDDSFCFCHIDVDVYESAKDIVNWIWPRMVVGGIIVFDDYGFDGCDGVTIYVNEHLFTKDRLVIHNLNGHAIMLKIK